ncbi:hypothetical protein PoB_000136500 [Plakobranchus ocellatus]|uniref:Secreted protein n=1 Tax=Plakobranchus ocellatus TaxID=259542 RepID=A0AAV3XWT1_9GAST|nr:hypothetical protein PoB_000136500 [Plakobranchus ocellatus]
MRVFWLRVITRCTIQRRLYCSCAAAWSWWLGLPASRPPLLPVWRPLLSAPAPDAPASACKLLNTLGVWISLSAPGLSFAAGYTHLSLDCPYRMH